MQNGFPPLSEGQGRVRRGAVGAASSGGGSPGHLTFKITAQWHTTQNIEQKCVAHFARSCFSFVLVFPFLSPVCCPFCFFSYSLFILEGLVCQFVSSPVCQFVSVSLSPIFSMFFVFVFQTDAIFQLFLQVSTFVLFHFLWTWKCLGRKKNNHIFCCTFKAIYVLKKTYI